MARVARSRAEGCLRQDGAELHAALPLFEARIRGEKVLESRGLKGTKMVAADLSIWMPGVLKVDPFPDPEIIQFEWYVPVDVDKHMYWRVLGKRAATPEDVDAWGIEFHSLWETLALRGFNDLDIWAREGLEEFYKDDEGWTNEHFFKPDACKVEWRKLASRYDRGIQPNHQTSARDVAGSR